jgi:PAS domain S-box-containing protein
MRDPFPFPPYSSPAPQGSRDLTSSMIAAQVRVTRALASTASLHAVAAAALQAIGEGTGLEAGIFWTVGADGAGSALEVWPEARCEGFADVTTHPLDCPCGLMNLVDGRERSRPGEARPPRCALERALDDAGLSVSLAVPLPGRTALRGMMTLLGTTALALEGGPHDLLLSMCMQLGEFLDRGPRDDEDRRDAVLFHAILDAVPDGILAVDRDGRIVECNAGAATLFGYEREKLVQMRVEDFMPAHHRARHAGLRRAFGVDPQRRFMRGGEPFQARRRDGTEFPVEVAIGPLDAPGLAALAVVRDVTERQAAATALARTEEQLRHAQKMDAIGRMAGGLAHDFNNFLCVISASAEFLESQELAGRDLEVVREIITASERAAALTRRLLMMSRKLPSAPRSVDVSAAVEETLHVVRRLVGETVRIDAHLGRGLGRVRIDRGGLEQVLLNFVTNARDAMPGGGVIRITTRSVTSTEPLTGKRETIPPGDYVELAVEDSGGGIDVESSVRLFEPFFTTKPTGQGTGLGLSIVYAIVKQAGGYVDVTSAEGRGTTFAVFLPVSLDRHESPTFSQRVSARRPGPNQPRSILVVEDDRDVLAVTVRMLRSAGFSVLAASTADEALDVCRATAHLDLVLSDLVMPGLTGVELALRLRHLRPTLPFVFMSGYPSTPAGFEEAANAFPIVSKPFTTRQLLATIDELLAPNEPNDRGR